jgi:hypothetical protein
VFHIDYLRIFLETNFHQKFLKEKLATNWNKILARGKKRLAQTRAMERKLKKIQALQAKQGPARGSHSAGNKGATMS